MVVARKEVRKRSKYISGMIVGIIGCSSNKP